MREKTCENCLFHMEGLCKRYPPTVTSAFQGNSGTVTAQAWPKTALSDTCGEFEREKRLW